MGEKGGNRRRRAGMWIAGLAVIAAIAATYHLTRPPELVWWTSPPIGKTGRHVRVLTPYGWKMRPQMAQRYDEWQAVYWVEPIDDRPRWMRSLFPKQPELHADVQVMISKPFIFGSPDDGETKQIAEPSGFGLYRAQRSVFLRASGNFAFLLYERNELAAFTATHAAICNSLRIE